MNIKEVGYNKSVVITEKIGEAYLSRREHERNATNRHVLAIAKCIEKTGWFGSVMAVTEGGELLDGQNRLLALRYLGWPSVRTTFRVFKDVDITPEIRSMFNKARPQSLRDTMKMCFDWGCNASRRVPVYCALARICMGREFTTDEYLMINIDDSFPGSLMPIIQCDSGRGELTSEMKCAFLLAATADTEKAIELKRDLVNMVFTSTKCHARRIYDFLHSDTIKSMTGRVKGNGCNSSAVKRVLFAIDKYIKNETCPILEHVDSKKLDEVAAPYISLMKEIVNFK